ADSTAPSVSASAIATTSGGTPIDGPGVVRAGGSYRVYAEVSDAGVGIASVRANVSNVTGAQTAATLTFDSTGVSVGGTTYHWVSAELTADSGLAAGTKSYSITAADTLTNSASPSFSVIADNTAPTVSLTTPTSNTTVSGSITPAATATDANGVAFVTIQRSPAGANTWTDICTDSTSPYSCSFDTTSVSDGLYDFRAVATDKGGNTASSTATNVQVSNSLKPVALQFDAKNCTTGPVTCVVGQANQNDTLTFAYSKPMLASSIISGWDGTTRSVRVNLSDAGSNDTLTEVQLDTGTGTVSLGTVALGQNYVNGGSVAFLSSSIVQSTDKTTFTITLGALCTTNVSPTNCGGGSTRQITNQTPSVVWTPNAAATDTAGNPVDATVTPTRSFMPF
ncbi:MAG TPA: Ig-like domain-containing protein, partial [Solirubrobacteraceae bacterium]|nr:Ig-like domain-containing protein [Solirubrobacteraceae bacterium]